MAKYVEEELTVQKNEDLNEDVEYRGARKDEEDLLLEAQRYLNVFHQLHIFKQHKKDEFDELLLKLSKKVKQILFILPGGKVLLEHLYEIEKKRGIEDEELEQYLAAGKKHYNKDMPIIETKKHKEDSFENLVKALNSYTQNMQNVNQNLEKKLQANSVENAATLTKTVTNILRENAKQQSDTLQNLGSIMSKSIVQSQKELVETLESRKKSDTVQKKIVLSKSVPTRRINEQGISEQPYKKIENNNENNIRKENLAAVNNIKSDTDNFQEQNKVQFSDVSVGTSDKNNPKDEAEKILATSFDVARPEFSEQTKNAAEGKEPLLSADSINEQSKPSKYDSAMQKIKDALGVNKTVELDNLDIEPVKLPDAKDEYDASLEKAFSELTSDNKTTNPPTPDSVVSDNVSSDEEWEYVDEDGNPVTITDDDEWEYVDEDGNPIK